MVRGFPLSVDRDVLLRRLGIRPDAYRETGAFGELFEETVARGYRLIEQAAVSKTLRVSGCARGTVSFTGTAFRIRSAQVAKLLSSCPLATLMAATIGRELSTEVEKLMAEGRMTEAMVLDAFGSEAVEEAVNVLCGMLGEAGPVKEHTLTRRFSPGYGDWPITEQAGIVGELGADGIGIDVNRSCVLIPEKSITAVAGWLKSDGRKIEKGIVI